MRWTSILLPFCAVLSWAAPVEPWRDPPGQWIRRAPMAEASRSIAIALSTNVHLAFDTELLRAHTAWTGSGLNLFGPPYHGGKSPFLATPGGTVLWKTPGIFSWGTDGPWSDGRRERLAGTRFRELRTQAGYAELVYDIGMGDGDVTRVREIPAHWDLDGQLVVERRFEVESCSKDLWHLAHAEMGKIAGRSGDGRAVWIQRTNDVLLAVLDGAPNVRWEPLTSEVSYEEVLNAEEGLDSAIRRVAVVGEQTRFFVRVPSHEGNLGWTVRTVICPDADVARRIAAGFGGSQPAAARPDRLWESAQPARWPGAASVSPGGDAFYRIERFPLPPEIRLMVTGMDWLGNGDLAVCTWPGDIYIVEGAQGPVEAARYRRFATGLNEPLGLKDGPDGMYVVQKSELTRIRDMDGNGEADLFQTVSDAWGYSGNYHAFAFGPVRSGNGDWLVFLCGQRGRWEMPYVGWGIRIGTDGEVHGFCRGLRAPNGIGTYGPKNDLFVTDNQGNWVGACKLSHLQAGRFYGYPSGTPAPRHEYDRPGAYEPPAVWFPRKLSPSTSGFETVGDSRFGPFEGQMIVGDFQNAILLRVALEQVNGKWQGAVWPFLRGFFSGVNRLSMGQDGRLYVGGLKNRAWAASAPHEFSLDRVAFTGRIPFEVLSVRAIRDGFRLEFTKPVDRSSASELENYYVTQHRYRHHAEYGSPEIDHDGTENSATEIEVRAAAVSDEGRAVELRLDGLRPGYVTTVRLLDVLDASGEELWHEEFHYTLNEMLD